MVRAIVTNGEASVSGPVGTPDAFARFVEPHLVPMAHLAARLLPDASDRDDVVQDSLLRAWQKAHTYDAERGDPLTWLLAIVADRCRQRRRRWRPWAAARDAAPGPTDPDSRIDIETALHHLPRRQLEVVALHYYVGLDVASTASVLRISVGTVKSTLFDARATLHRLLGESYG